MNKLKAAVLYECSTKIKAMCIFYAIQYIIVALIFGMIALFVGGENVGSNVLEVSTVVFVSVMGVQGGFQGSHSKRLHPQIYFPVHHFYVCFHNRSNGSH